MEVTAIQPSARLAPFVSEFTFVDTEEEATRVLMPATGVVIGLRYSGSATQLDGEEPRLLPDATIAGVRASTRTMQTSAGGGVVLATFREGGAARFLPQPLHEIHGETLALDDLVPRSAIEEIRSRIAEASGRAERVALFEQFLLDRELPDPPDPIVSAAVAAIRSSRGAVRIADLARHLGISHDPLEKRFRRAVGATPKQFASLIRFRHAVNAYRSGETLTAASIDAGYFDQAHFNRHFRAVTGEAPKRLLGADYC